MTHLQKLQIGFIFSNFKSSFSNLCNRLTASMLYLIRIISATDLFAENLSFNKNKNTSAKTLTIVFTVTRLTLKSALLQCKWYKQTTMTTCYLLDTDYYCYYWIIIFELLLDYHYWIIIGLFINDTVNNLKLFFLFQNNATFHFNFFFQ